MANGTSESEKMAVRSPPRCGLKRELAFALKSISQLSGSVGRTRSGKRRLIASDAGLTKPQQEVSLVENPILVEDSDASDKETAVQISPPEKLPERAVLLEEAGEMVTSPRDEVPSPERAVSVSSVKNGVGEGTPPENGVVAIGELEDRTIPSPERHAERASVPGENARMDEDMTQTSKTADSTDRANAENIAKVPSVEDLPNGTGAGSTSQISTEEMPTGTLIVVGGDIDAGKTESRSLISLSETPSNFPMPSKRITRSMLKDNQKSSEASPPRNCTSEDTLLTVYSKAHEVVENDKAHEVVENGKAHEVVENGKAKTSLKIEKKKSKKSGWRSSKNIEPKRSADLEQLEREKLKMTVFDKCPSKKSGWTSLKNIEPKRSADLEQLEREMLKMAVFDKCPSNINELFATGLLEGLYAKYIFTKGGKVRSRGIIQGCGIVCHCNFCKGTKIVTATQLAKHISSRTKPLEDVFYLESGKSVNDILKACNNVPLDMVEAVIESTIGISPLGRNKICMTCRVSFHPSKAGASVSVCSTCVELKQFQTSPPHGTGGKLQRFKNPVSIATSSGQISKCITRSKNTCQRRVSKKLKNPVLIAKSFGRISKHTTRPKKIGQGRVMKKDLGQHQLVVYTGGVLDGTEKAQYAYRKKSKHITQPKKTSHGKVTKKDLGLHKLVFTEDGLPDGTELAYYARGQRLLEGYKKGNGIFCFCCNSEVSPSQFEAHAGWASSRQPYLHIYTSNGVSLHELSLSLSKGRKLSTLDNDDLCSICFDGGNLLLCDLCPRAFHTECVGLSSIPRGKWYCRYCHNLIQKEKCVQNNVNAVAAGRISGVDPIEQISKRSIRIVKVKTQEAEVSCCVLCRLHDFSKSRFGPRTVLLCDQCEREYHIGCLKDHKMANLKELPKGKWFCCGDCSRIHGDLQKLILRGFVKLPKSLLAIIKTKHNKKGWNYDGDCDVRWRLLSGKFSSPETRILLSKAVGIFHDRFDPIIDLATGQDFIPSMVYGRNMRVQEFAGMYCAVLTVNSHVVSAGMLRILGQDVAELPLVATSSINQGQGYFESLFSCLEDLLRSLKVKNFVLPAAEEANSIWTEKFGFKNISLGQLREYGWASRLMVFQGTSMLHKLVPKCKSIMLKEDS